MWLVGDLVRRQATRRDYRAETYSQRGMGQWGQQDALSLCPQRVVSHVIEYSRLARADAEEQWPDIKTLADFKTLQPTESPEMISRLLHWLKRRLLPVSATHNDKPIDFKTAIV